MARRYELCQAYWERIAHSLSSKAGDPGHHASDNWLFVHIVLWIALERPAPRYRLYKSVHKRFCCWANKGVWEKVFVMLDASLVKVHQQAATGKKGATKLRL